ncbi:MAG: RluA family pseudouridine synthase [Clostridia bacterium]|nr:RluA family pseudouridine synthase [Clostridia bacterium]
MPVLYITVPPSLKGTAAKDVLRRLGHLSSSNLRSLRDRGGLFLNGTEIPGYVRVSDGDVLSADLSDIPAEVPVLPGKPPEVLYADDWLAAVNKPAGIATHASTFHPGEETMHEKMAALWGADMVYHPVNRLDRYTSGVMCVARCGYMHERMKTLLHTDGFVRVYLAVCVGKLPESRGTVDLPIGREEGSVLKRTAGCGSPAVTDYRVLAEGGGRSLVVLRPRTGRTHQIRVHLSALGCPIAGDFLYGDETEAARTLLHSAALRLSHPVSGAAVTLRAELPGDMRDYMARFGLASDITEDLFDV